MCIRCSSPHFTQQVPGCVSASPGLGSVQVPCFVWWVEGKYCSPNHTKGGVSSLCVPSNNCWGKITLDGPHCSCSLGCSSLLGGHTPRSPSCPDIWARPPQHLYMLPPQSKPSQGAGAASAYRGSKLTSPLCAQAAEQHPCHQSATSPSLSSAAAGQGHGVRWRHLLSPPPPRTPTGLCSGIFSLLLVVGGLGFEFSRTRTWCLTTRSSKLQLNKSAIRRLQ